ncbi:MAG: rhodanese-like domain-containing protein [Deferribacterales bacterium]
MRFKLFTLIMLLMTFVSANAFMQSANSKDQPLTMALYKTGIKIIDIRTEDEWKQTGIVKGSSTIEFFDSKGNYNVKNFVSQLDKKVNKNEPFAIICRTGNRTSNVIGLLRQLGYSQAIDIKGGVVQAAKNGIPFEKYK